jgi:hypothetical protein
MADDAYVELPDRVELTLDEVRMVLAAIDHGRELAPKGSEAGRVLAEADRLLVAKVWPELGDLLGDEDG